MEPQVIGDWVLESTLGTGGFGMVMLWRNKSTNQKLALKKCRWVNDPMMTPKHRQRWELEVQIMRKLQHPNVVTAVPVPSELDVNPSEIPVLAMEYCSKGDLRKVLNNPENCCGLTENNVRSLIRDITCAINFLHSVRIIHRDLKPENVVVQDVDGKSVYKLTDLGYAKELDQGSLCTSFVGTLQYLAPELFLSQEYTCTVDYWSLGLVAHEAMLGVRPFLPNFAPAEWMKHVCKKKPNDICVYTTPDGVIHYSQHIFEENRLSKPFIEYMEKWLRVMLEWNPQRRGIDFSGGVKKYLAFSMFEDILQKKIIHFFYVKTGQVHSYEIDDTTSTNEVLLRLSRDIGGSVSPDDLECYSPRGDLIDRNKNALQMHCADLQEDEEWLIYVFTKSIDKNDYKVENIIRKRVASVERMLEDENYLYSYDEQKRIWAHCVYFTELEMILNKRYHAAYRVLMTYLVKCNSQVMQMNSKVMSEKNKLIANLEFFKNCVHADKESYENAKKSTGLTSSQLENTLKIDQTISEVDELQMKITVQESATTAVNSKTLILQQSFYSKSNSFAPAENFYKKALEFYTALRKKTKEQRRIPSDNLPMLAVIRESLQKRDEHLTQYFIHLQKVEDCKKEIARVLTPFSNLLESTRQLSKNIIDLQIKRQNIVWKALNTLILKQKKKQTSPPILENSPESIQEKSETPMSSESISLSNILSKNSEDSLIAIQENQRMRSKLNEQFESLTKNLPQEYDWSYLTSLTKRM